MQINAHRKYDKGTRLGSRLLETACFPDFPDNLAGKKKNN